MIISLKEEINDLIVCLLNTINLFMLCQLFLNSCSALYTAMLNLQSVKAF